MTSAAMLVLVWLPAGILALAFLLYLVFSEDENEEGP